MFASKLNIRFHNKNNMHFEKQENKWFERQIVVGFGNREWNVYFGLEIDFE